MQQSFVVMASSSQQPPSSSSPSQGVCKKRSPSSSSPSQGVCKKRKSYDSAFKLKVVEYAEKYSNRAATRQFGIASESCIRDWRKKKAQLQGQTSKKQRLTGGGRKPIALEMEDQLIAWIDSLRSDHIRVTRSAIQRKALELYDGEENFLPAEAGWKHFSSEMDTPYVEKQQQVNAYLKT